MGAASEGCKIARQVPKNAGLGAIGTRKAVAGAGESLCSSCTQGGGFAPWVELRPWAVGSR